MANQLQNAPLTRLYDVRHLREAAIFQERAGRCQVMLAFQSIEGVSALRETLKVVGVRE
jgi:hypothetical protein